MFGLGKDKKRKTLATILDDAAARAMIGPLKAEAADLKAGMTLDELDRFVHDALAMGAGPDTVVMHRCNPRGSIRKVWVK